MAQPKIEVEVTQDLVERATKRDSQHCMIAEAIKRQDPENRRQIWVDLQTIRYTDVKRGKRIIALTPPAAADALIAFDRGDPIEAFAFAARIIQRTPVKPPRGRARLNSQMVLEGGDPNRIPRAHIGGTDSLEGSASRRASVRHQRRQRDSDTELQAKVERGELSQIQASSKKFRRYGLRLLRD